MAKLKAQQKFVDPDRGPLVSTRFVVAIVLVVVGIAWMVYYYTQVRVDPTAVPTPKAGSPAFLCSIATPYSRNGSVGSLSSIFIKVVSRSLIRLIVERCRPNGQCGNVR